MYDRNQAYQNHLKARMKKDKNKKEPPNQVAEKMKQQKKEYRKIVSEMLAENPSCELKTPECTGTAQGLHHMKKRGANLLKKKYLKRACNACNGYVERHPQYALDHGLSISKFKKEEVNNVH